MNGTDSASGGKIIYDLTANLRPFEEGLSQAEKTAKKTGSAIEEGFNSGASGAAKSVQKLSTSVLSNLKDISKGLASISWDTITTGSATALTSLLATSKKAISDTQFLENANIQMQSFTGSVEAGSQAMAEAYKFFKNNPFDRFTTVDAVKNMIQFGAAMEDIPDQLEILGNISLSTGANLSDLASIYQRSLADNKIGLMDLEVLANRGVPVYKGFAEALGMTSAQVRELTADGALTGDMLKKVFKYLSDNAGPAMAQFEQTLSRQQDRLAGGFSNLRGLLAGYKVTTNGLEMANDGLYASFVALETEFINIFRGTQITKEQYEKLSPTMKKFVDNAGGVEAYNKRNAAVADKLNAAMSELGVVLAEILVKLADKLPGIIDSVATVFKFLADHSSALIPVATAALVAFGKIGGTLPGVGGIVNGFAQSVNLLTKGLGNLTKTLGGAVLQKMGLFKKTAQDTTAAVAGKVASQTSGAVDSAGGLAKSLSSNNSFFSKAASAAGGIVAFAGAMVAVAGALRLIYELFRGIDLGGLIVSFGIAATAMGTMAVMAGVMSKFKSNFIKGAAAGVAVVAFAAEIAIVAAIFRTLPTIEEWGNLSLSALAAAGAFTSIGILAAVAGIPAVITQLWQGVIGGVAIVAFAAELAIVAAVLRTLPGISEWGEISLSLLAIAGAFTAIGVLAAVAGIPAVIAALWLGVAGAAAIVAFSAELLVIAHLLQNIPEVDLDKIANLAGMIGELTIIGGLMAASSFVGLMGTIGGGFLTAMSAELKIIAENFAAAAIAAGLINAEGMQNLVDVMVVMKYIGEIMSENIFANFFSDNGSGLAAAARNLYEIVSQVRQSIDLIEPIAYTLSQDGPDILDDISDIVDFMVQTRDKINGNIWANFFANDEGSGMVKASKNLHEILTNVSESMKLISSVSKELDNKMDDIMNQITKIVNWFVGEDGKSGVAAKINGNIWANFFANDEGAGMAKASKNLHIILTEVSESLKLVDEVAGTLNSSLETVMKNIDTIVDWFTKEGGVYDKINGNIWANWFANDEGSGLAKAADNLHKIINGVSESLKIADNLATTLKEDQETLLKNIDHIVQIMKENIWPKINGSAWDGIFNDEGEGLGKAAENLSRIMNAAKTSFDVAQELGKQAASNGTDLESRVQSIIDTMKRIADSINNAGGGWFSDNGQGLLDAVDKIKQISEKTKETFDNLKDVKEAGLNKVLLLKQVITNMNGFPEPQTEKMDKIKTFMESLSGTFNADSISSIVECAELLKKVNWEEFSKNLQSLISTLNTNYPDLSSFKTFFTTLNEALKDDVTSSLSSLFELFTTYNAAKMEVITKSATSFIQFVQGNLFAGIDGQAWDSSKVQNFKTFFQNIGQALKNDVASALNTLFDVFSKFNPESMGKITDSATKFIQFVQGDSFGGTAGEGGVTNAWDSSKVTNFKTFFTNVREALQNDVAGSIDTLLTVFNKFSPEQVSKISESATNFVQFVQGENFGPKALIPGLKGQAWDSKKVENFKTFFQAVRSALDGDVSTTIDTFLTTFGKEIDWEKIKSNLQDLIKVVNGEVGDLKEAWNTSKVENFKNYFEIFNEAIKDDVAGKVTKFVDAFKGEGFDKIEANAEYFIKTINKDWPDSTKGERIAGFFNEFSDISDDFSKPLAFMKGMAGLKDFSEDAITGSEAFVTAMNNIATALGQSLWANLDQLSLEIGNFLLQAVQNGIESQTDPILEKFDYLVETIFECFDNDYNYSLFMDMGNLILEGMNAGITDSEELLFNTFNELAEVIREIFDNDYNYSLFMELGNMLVMALGDGMLESTELLTQDIQSFATLLYNTFYSEENYYSFTELGNMIVLAIGEGMLNSYELLFQDVQTFANLLYNVFYSEENYMLFTELGNMLVMAIGDGLNNSQELLIQDIQTFANLLYNTFYSEENYNLFTELGNMIVIAIGDGIADSIGLMTEDVFAFANLMYDTFYNCYDIFAELGNMVVFAIGDGMVESFDLTHEDMMALIDFIYDEFYSCYSVFQQMGYEFVETYSTGFSEAFRLITDGITSIVNLSDRTFASQQQVFRNIGSNMVAGIANGLTSNIWRINLALGMISSAAVTRLRSLLGIHSPSTVFYEMGTYMGEGLVNGLTDMATEVAEATESLVSTINAELNDIEVVNLNDKIATGISNKGSSSQTVKNITFNNNNNISNGLDMSAFLGQLRWDMARS